METYEAAAIVLIIAIIVVLVVRSRKTGQSVGHELSGVKNDVLGWFGDGTSRPPSGASQKSGLHGRDVQARSGSYITPEALAAAEQQAWAPSSSTAAPRYDVLKGRSPGSDLTQQLGNYQEGDWGQQLTDLALDSRTREQHRKWVDEVGPFSQGAFSVDNLDEAVAMAQPRQGITAFRALALPQGPYSMQLTELDSNQYNAQFNRQFRF